MHQCTDIYIYWNYFLKLLDINYIYTMYEFMHTTYRRRTFLDSAPHMYSVQ